MSEINVSKQITEQEIRKNLEKELQIMQMGKKFLNNANKLMNEVNKLCEEIIEYADINKEFLQYIKGKEKFVNERSETYKMCIEINRKFMELKDLIFDLFYES